MQDSSSFGQWLKLRRRALDLTQSQLAKQVGYSERTIRKLEADELRPSKQMAEVLAAHLGIAPQERESFIRFARGNLLERAAQASGFNLAGTSPWRTAQPPLSNLPVQLTSFVGREREIIKVAELLGSTRLLTLTGVGGVGKTRLAIQVAGLVVDRYADGIRMVELAPLADPALLPQALSTALRLSDAGGPPLTAVIDYLRPKHFLLIVDNCEHLVVACAEMAETLLRECPALCLLAISREPLGIPGETNWIVQPLSLRDPIAGAPHEIPHPSEAERLFVERAKLIFPSFSITRQNANVVERICQRLDGIPLAIELAAARVKGLELEQIAARLDNSFQLLAGENRRTVPRHRTLRATIDWSYALLTETERVLLGRLPVFSGGWSLEGAEQVCGFGGLTEDQVLDLLLHLLDKSLVVAESAGSEKRYRLLETIRQYMAEKLDESGEFESVRDSHLDYFCKLAEKAAPNLKTAEQKQWLDRLEEERDNLRAAWEWAIDRNPERALRLSRALLEFWMRRGYTNEAREKSGRLVARTADWGVSISRARVLLIAGRVAIRETDYSTALTLMQQALTIAQAVGSKYEVAIGLRGVGVAARGLGDNETAHRFLESSLGLLQELGEDWYAANVLQALTIMAGDNGNYVLSQKLGEKAIALFQKTGDLASVSYALHSMGLAAIMQGDYERSAMLYGKALELARKYENEYQIVIATFGLGLACLRLGAADGARAGYEQAVEQVRHQGKGPVSAWLIGMAGVLNADGKPEVAARLLGAGEAGIESAHYRLERAHRIEIDYIRGRLCAQLGETRFAEWLAEGGSLTLEQAVSLALTESKR